MKKELNKQIMYLGKKITAKFGVSLIGVVLLASCGSSSDSSGTTPEAWGDDEQAFTDVAFDKNNAALNPKEGDTVGSDSMEKAKKEDENNNAKPLDSLAKKTNNEAEITEESEDCSDLLADLNAQIMALKQNNESLNERLEKSLLEQPPMQTNANNYSAPDSKVFYRLQISAISASADKKIYPGMEAFIENYGGKFRFMYGYFTKYQDAKEARNMLERIGFKGAWIVKYIDGKRLDK